MPINKPAPAAVAGVNFGDLGMYSGGAMIPDGDYILYFMVMMYQPTDKTTGANKGPATLGVMVDFFPMDNPVEDHKLQKFYSMGRKADQSFAPNPETGKGIVPIPGAAGTNLNDKTNWFMLLNSLYDSGLPQGVFSNDLTVIDGVHVHVTNVDEPAERASFQSNTAEVQATGPRTPMKVAIVTEIKEDGKPWEGTGGLPATTAAAKPNGKAAAPKPVAKPAAAPKPAAAAAAPAASTTEGISPELRDAASAGISAVLEKKPNGCPRLALRTETFKSLKGNPAYGEEVAAAVINSFFEAGMEDNLSGVLAELGYAVKGVQVAPA